MSFIEIEITDDGEHWHKRIKLLGLMVYNRHDFTKGEERRTVGFNAMAPVSGEIEDTEL